LFCECSMGDAIQAEPVMEAEKLKSVHDSSSTAATELFRTKAIGENVRSFEDEMNVRLPFPSPKHFHSNPKLHSTDFPPFFSSQKETIAKSFLAKELENWKRSGDFCKDLLKRLFHELVQSVADGSVSTTEGLETRWQQFLRDYEKENKGPAKYHEFFKAADMLLEAARKVTQLEVSNAEEKGQCFPLPFVSRALVN